MLNKSNEKITFISFIQTFSMILIVLSHSVVKGIDYPVWVSRYIRMIQNIGLVSFMWCSGYLFIMTSSLEKYGYKEYIIRRFRRLMIPFFVIQIVIYIPKLLISHYLGDRISISIDSFLLGFLFPRDGILPHLWFLPTLMIICVLSPILLKVTENIFLSCIVLLLFIAFLYIPLNTNILCLRDVKNYLLWFFTGMLFAKLNIVQYLKKIRAVIFLALISFIFAICFLPNGSVLQNLVSGISAIVILIFLGCHVDNKILNKTSNYTFSIYILSLPVQNILEIVLGRIGANWLFAMLVSLFCGIMIPIAIALLIRKIDNGKKHNYLSICIGQ